MLTVSALTLWTLLIFWLGYCCGYKVAYNESIEKLEEILRRFGWTS